MRFPRPGGTRVVQQRCWFIVAAAIVISACASNAIPAAAIDPDRLFAPSENAATVTAAAGCGSDDDVAIYLETIRQRRTAVIAALEAQSADAEIELRLGLTRATPWTEIAPLPDSGVRASAIGMVLSEASNHEVVEAHDGTPSGDPLIGLIGKLEDRVDARQVLLTNQQDRYERAVAGGNEKAIDTRESAVRTQTRKLQQTQRELDNTQEKGPDAAALALKGNPADLSSYLNALPERLLHDAVIVTDPTAQLIRTRWDSSFTSVSELQVIFANSAMLPMGLQLRATNSGYGCADLGG